MSEQDLAIGNIYLFSLNGENWVEGTLDSFDLTEPEPYEDQNGDTWPYIKEFSV